MILWIFVLITVVGIIWYMIDEWSFTAIGLIVTGGVFLITSLIIIAINQGTKQTSIMELEDKQRNIESQIVSCSVRDDILFESINKYNKKIINGKYYQSNIWTNVFVPNIYDDFETFDYDEINCNLD